MNSAGIDTIWWIVFVAIVGIAFLLPWIVDENERQDRRLKSQRREHFEQTARYRQECDPVFEGLNKLGSELERM